MLVLNLVIIALGITLEPIPFTAFALVLASKNGVSKAAFFISGWILSLAQSSWPPPSPPPRTGHRSRRRPRPPRRWR